MNSSNHEKADDSSTVFDADTVTPDEVPSTSLPAMPPLPALAATATATNYLYNNNVTMISSSPHSSQKESPQSFTSELLRRINSQRSPAEPSTTTAAATAPVYDTNTVIPGQEESPATATRSEEMSRSNHHQSSSSSSSKKRPIANSSSHSSTKRPRRSSRLKRQSQPQDQSCVDKSDSEVEDENIFEDYEPDEAVTNQSSSSSSQISSKQKRQNELRWKSKFKELRDYKRLHGHANVPQSNKQLGVWVMTQRKQYKKFKKNGKSPMTPERIEMLKSIDFDWVSPNKGGPRNESTWNKRFTELKTYKEKYGRTNISQRSRDNKQLGRWVSTQRKQYKKFKKNGKSQITPERIELLESIGFQWEPSKWDERFNELVEFKENYGHTNVPQNFKANKQLGLWVKTQRTQYKKFKKNGKSQITPERIDLLNSIGFQW